MHIPKSRSPSPALTPPNPGNEPSQKPPSSITQTAQKAIETVREEMIQYLRHTTNQTLANCSMALHNAQGDLFRAKEALEAINRQMFQLTGGMCFNLAHPTWQ